jgi:hypothetical protein
MAFLFFGSLIVSTIIVMVLALVRGAFVGTSVKERVQILASCVLVWIFLNGPMAAIFLFSYAILWLGGKV